jgi:pimeloyl-ACP methyl ester carboxylesterase
VHVLQRPFSGGGGRRRAGLVAAALVAGAVGAVAPVAQTAAPHGHPAATTASTTIATAPVKVAMTRRGAVGYRSVGSGPPLVLIMGFGASMEDWLPKFVDDLARRHRVVIFDNAGIGQSKALTKVTISGMADQTSALIGALKLGRADVLGWSMGGMIAQALVVRHPNRVRRLVLAATQPGTGTAKRPSKRAAEALAEATATAEGFFAALFPPEQSAARKAYAAGLERYVERSTVPDALYGTQRAAINGWRAGREPAGHKVTKSAIRTLVAGGTADRFLPIANSRLLARLFPRAQLRLYRHAGHAFLFQPSTRFVARVNSFLR